MEQLEAIGLYPKQDHLLLIKMIMELLPPPLSILGGPTNLNLTNKSQCILPPPMTHRPTCNTYHQIRSHMHRDHKIGQEDYGAGLGPDVGGMGAVRVRSP